MSGRDAGDAEGVDDLYETLGVDAHASGDQIASAYRRLAREHHPDSNPDAESGRFGDVTDAYDVLRDPTRRRAYDHTRRTRADAARVATGQSIPVHHRSTPREERPRDEPQQIELALTFEQAALGTTVPLAVQDERPCSACGASGISQEPCPSCGGAGSTSRASGPITIRHVCDTCEGTGRRRLGCTACAGTGRLATTRQLNVRVPAGVDDGTRIRVPVPHGDRPITAVVRTAPHEYFGRRGRDLTLTVPVTIAEAALGAVITVPTLADAVAIRLPPGTRHGRVLRVRGRGIPFHDHPSDLLVTVDLVVPETLNHEQRAALEAFAAATRSPRGSFERPGRSS